VNEWGVDEIGRSGRTSAWRRMTFALQCNKVSQIEVNLSESEEKKKFVRDFLLNAKGKWKTTEV
jgi:hypothetical protein